MGFCAIMLQTGNRAGGVLRKNLVGNRNQSIISGLMVDIKGSRPTTNERGFHLPTASTGMGFRSCMSPLSEIFGSPFAAGASPKSLAVDGSGLFLYIVNAAPTMSRDSQSTP